MALWLASRVTRSRIASVNLGIGHAGVRGGRDGRVCPDGAKHASADADGALGRNTDIFITSSHSPVFFVFG